MKIYLDGLERSGNVFLSYAISLITGKEVVAVRDHMVKVLKDYDKEYPFVVPVRDALPCIASAKIYRDKVVTNKFHESGENDTKEFPHIIKVHAEYIQYLVDNPKFFIAPFHEFTKDPMKFMCKLSNKYPDIKVTNSITCEKIKEIVSQNEDAYDTESGNLPRTTPKKQEIEEILKSQFLEEIQAIQLNIDTLYERYSNLSYCENLCYNLPMTETIEPGNPGNPQQCCLGCTCTEIHRSKPEEE
jgi:hypothetical protein